MEGGGRPNADAVELSTTMITEEGPGLEILT